VARDAPADGAVAGCDVALSISLQRPERIGDG
jgi:hypothetical protein